MNNKQNNPAHSTLEVPLVVTSATSTNLSSQTTHHYINPFAYRISISWFGGVHIYPKFR